MSGWLIMHAHEIGLVCSGFVAGVFFAAWRQLSLERVEEEWERP